jgi:N-acetylmuramoyl-L-alanine amidase
MNARSVVAAAVVAVSVLASAPSLATATPSPTSSKQRRPVIVIDPGHSRTIFAIDKRTGLDVSDYENEPEMRNVFAVALLVRKQLIAAGYRVVMTKRRDDQRVSLGQRAAIANRVHAALALSIHDQAGANGGIPFRTRTGAGNNIVYYQSVGTYRETPSGHKVHFHNLHVAQLSRRYGRIFARERHRVEHTHIRLQGSVGYNLGSRGLPAGNIWLVQLLSKVPWIYNESGGNSAGRSGLDRADRHTYARALVAAVERCVPLHH